MSSENPGLTGDQPDSIVADMAGPAHGGSVIARHDGHVVFVRGALPGEQGVHIHLDPPGTSKKASRFRTGVAGRIGQPHPGRVDPQCSAAAAGAGCCDLDFVDPQGSAQFKRDVVIDQLSRIAKLAVDPHLVEVHTVAPFTGWRARVRLGVDKGGVIGLRAKNSHAIIPASHHTCAQWHPDLAEKLSQALPQLASQVTPGAELALALGDDGQLGCVEVTHHRGRPGKTRNLPGCAQTVTRQLQLPGQPQGHTVTWELPVESFWQGHVNAPTQFAGWIANTLPAAAGDNAVIWDLYGGAGVFAAALHRHAATVDSVDVASASTEAGQQALKAAGVDSVRFVAGDVATTMGQLVQDGLLHAVVVDPPRTGMGRGVVDAIALHEPHHVIHVGCDPATAARDIKGWVDHGYHLEKLSVWDTYGLTHHVELIAHLTKAMS
ncbi:MAG TPA: class I SAM-dependent RNA methyltransferase [Candidatus Corynebacterium gallistercoris]|uniref:Class I SAM-dependent RNA methyltransferase n=1 Tax=Candidatus Corynebacterium gallistercoris TaxID=2838530 RepID=A0A9D1RWU4_9CORY|nr:class I SAM-dependent RNA methyltransferase [Candidatus Corynebacterium gallistercoris]